MVLLSSSAFLLSMVPLYVMSLIGFLGRKIGMLQANTNQVITQLMLNITLPALILFSLQTTFSRELLTDFLWLVFMSTFILGVSVYTAAWLRKRAKLPIEQKTVYESLIIFGNQGFIGFAVSYIILGNQGIIYLTFFNICYLILIWTYGIYLFKKTEKSIEWKALFFNPGILSTIIGLIMLFLPFNWPEPLLETFETVGKMTIPLSMLLIGSLLAEINLQDLKKYSKNLYIWIAASFRLLILPMFLFLFLLFPVSFPLLIIAVLTSAMPSASTTSLYAQKFGGDAAFASFGVIVTTVLCIFTIPLLYSLLQWFFSYFYH